MNKEEFNKSIEKWANAYCYKYLINKQIGEKCYTTIENDDRKLIIYELKPLAADLIIMTIRLDKDPLVKRVIQSTTDGIIEFLDSYF